MLEKVETRRHVCFSMWYKVSNMRRVIPALGHNMDTSSVPHGNHLFHISVWDQSVLDWVQIQVRAAGWVFTHKRPVVVSWNPRKWNAFGTSGHDRYNNHPYEQEGCEKIFHDERLIVEAHEKTHTTNDVHTRWTAIKNNTTESHWCKCLAVVDKVRQKTIHTTSSVAECMYKNWMFLHST